MKNTIIASLIILQAAISSAKELSFADMQRLLPDMERSGKGYSSEELCSVKTKWLSNGDLFVAITSYYSDWKPSTMAFTLTKAKNADIQTDHWDGQTEYTLSQSTVLLEDGDYRVDLIELFSFKIKDSTIVGARVQTLEIDHENDPHDDLIDCNFSN